MQVESFRMQVIDGSLLLEFDGADQYLHPFYEKCVNSQTILGDRHRPQFPISVSIRPV
jgi:hypothetical protein